MNGAKIASGRGRIRETLEKSVFPIMRKLGKPFTPHDIVREYFAFTNTAPSFKEHNRIKAHIYRAFETWEFTGKIRFIREEESMIAHGKKKLYVWHGGKNG